MNIQTVCPSCNKSLRVDKQHAGKLGKCPSCKQPVQIPHATGISLDPPQAQASPVPQAARGATWQVAQAPKAKQAPTKAPSSQKQQAENPANTYGEDLLKEIFAALVAPIKPVQVSASYRFGILLVSLVMLVLPLIYVGLILAVCAGLAVYAVSGLSIITSVGSGKGAILGLLLYAGPLVAGGLLIIFMIKPLFARSAKAAEKRALTRENEPLLFAFVDRLCIAVGSPKPTKISVDCDVNASAGFRRGIISMVGSDMELTIGLPLAAGLTMPQFAGVLAHEFGHFSQGAGMRMSYMIRSISWWFTRVVYERDEWDQWLVEMAHETDFRIGWIFYVTRLFVWMTRKVLWLLMISGHLVSGFLLRQMEFDADRYETRLAGSQTFESTSRRLTFLNIAYQGAQSDLSDFFQDGRLADDLPKLIMHNITQIPKKFVEQINADVNQSKTGLFDTHPADSERIRSAHNEKAEGVFHIDRPATDLFRDFNYLAKMVSYDFYRNIFGPELKQSMLNSVDGLVAHQEGEQKASQAAQRYFQASLSPLRPVTLASYYCAAPKDPQAVLKKLQAARSQMIAFKKEFNLVLDKYDQFDTQLVDANQALALYDSSLQPRDVDFSVLVSTWERAASARRTAQKTIDSLGGELRSFELAVSERLFCALQLFHTPQVNAKIENAATWKKECERLLPAMEKTTRLWPSFMELRVEYASLAILLANLDGNNQNESLINAIFKFMKNCNKLIFSLVLEFQQVDYPFDHAKGQINISQYMVTQLPSEEDLQSVYNASHEVLDNMLPLYSRIVGRLALLAEEVEKVVGLEPLPEPSKEET